MDEFHCLLIKNFNKRQPRDSEKTRHKLRNVYNTFNLQGIINTLKNQLEKDQTQ